MAFSSFRVHFLYFFRFSGTFLVLFRLSTKSIPSPLVRRSIICYVPAFQLWTSLNLHHILCGNYLVIIMYYRLCSYWKEKNIVEGVHSRSGFAHQIGLWSKSPFIVHIKRNAVIMWWVNLYHKDVTSASYGLWQLSSLNCQLKRLTRNYW